MSKFSKSNKAAVLTVVSIFVSGSVTSTAFASNTKTQKLGTNAPSTQTPTMPALQQISQGETKSAFNGPFAYIDVPSIIQGGTINSTGSGFHASANVAVKVWDSTGSTLVRTLNSATTDASGKFNLASVIPRDLAVGNYKIEYSDLGGADQAWINLTVTSNPIFPDAGGVIPAVQQGNSVNHAVATNADSCELTSGNLPESITLDTTSCKLLGTPTQHGNFSFTIKATKGSNSLSQNFVWSVTNDTPPTPGPSKGISFPGDVSGQVTVTGTKIGDSINSVIAYGATKCEVNSGVLPIGLDIQNCTFVGNLVAIGNFDFTIRAYNAQGEFVDEKFNWNVTSDTAIFPDAGGVIPAGQQGNSVNHAVATNTDSCALTKGTLPQGVTLDTAACKLTGTPTQHGNFSFTISATKGSKTVSQDFTWTVNATAPTPTPPAPSPTPSPAPSGGGQDSGSGQGGSGNGSNTPSGYQGSGTGSNNGNTVSSNSTNASYGLFNGTVANNSGAASTSTTGGLAYTGANDAWKTVLGLGGLTALVGTATFFIARRKKA